MRGAIAAGHRETVAAAAAMLEDGGNAFDAALAALTAAFVAEPVLASPAGGGFLMAQPSGSAPRVFDFFVHTPATRRTGEDLDFYPIAADFGTTTQEFHIGLGSVAVPGVVAGMFEVQRALGTRPMEVLMRPGIELARRGLTMTPFQARLLEIVRPCFTATDEVRDIFASPTRDGELVGAGEVLTMPELADSLEAIAREGERLVYEGEIAQRIVVAQETGGGQLTAADLASYATEERTPLTLGYGDATIHLNPPPASGGLLIGFGLELLSGRPTDDGPDDPLGLERLAQVMEATQEARVAATALDGEMRGDMLQPALVDRYRRSVLGRRRARRGTTHISVADAEGNLASLTVSNGEGSGHVIEGTGIVLNNMLGEEDLNPGGFGRWPLSHRMTSMMAPTLVAWPDGRRCALGSGGSNRIRSAVLQVLLGLIDAGLPLTDAVRRPRIHFEDDLLSIEGGFVAADTHGLDARYAVHRWEEQSLFFGGVHAVSAHGPLFDAAADPRRDGHDRVLAEPSREI